MYFRHIFNKELVSKTYELQNSIMKKNNPIRNGKKFEKTLN